MNLLKAYKQLCTGNKQWFRIRVVICNLYKCFTFLWRRAGLLVFFIRCSSNVVSIRVIFWGVSFLSYFRFLYFQGAFTETVFPLPLVGYEITVGQLGATRIVSYLPFYRQRVEYTLTAPSNLVKLFTTQTWAVRRVLYSSELPLHWLVSETSSLKLECIDLFVKAGFTCENWFHFSTRGNFFQNGYRGASWDVWGMEPDRTTYGTLSNEV